MSNTNFLNPRETTIQGTKVDKKPMMILSMRCQEKIAEEGNKLLEFISLAPEREVPEEYYKLAMESEKPIDPEALLKAGIAIPDIKKYVQKYIIATGQGWKISCLDQTFKEHLSNNENLSQEEWEKKCQEMGDIIIDCFSHSKYNCYYNTWEALIEEARKCIRNTEFAKALANSDPKFLKQIVTIDPDIFTYQEKQKYSDEMAKTLKKEYEATAIKMASDDFPI